MSKRPTKTRSYVCAIKVDLIKTDKQIMKAAAELGEDSGRDIGWKPETLNEAVAEIILMSDAPAECGVEIIDY